MEISKKPLERAVILVLIITALILRFLCFDYITLDYTNFLSKWVQFFRENGGFKALNQPVGNYNVPYLYFLAAFSYSSIPDLYLIKLLSVVFDFVLAFFSMRLVSVFTGSRFKQWLCFFIVLFLPTVILNGALWGQCDSIYAAFAVMSVYLVLRERPVLGMIAIALSFAFKLQAVFIMPLFFVFLYTKKIKLRHLLIFPVTYLVTVLPVVLLGRPLADTITLYFNQASTVGSGLNYNSPSLYSFVGSAKNPELLAKLGIVAAFLLVLGVFVLLFIKRARVTNRVLLTAALFFTIAIPLLLPHMHDRYFFMADILAVVYAVINWKRTPVPVLVSYASLLGYHAYLITRYFHPMRYGSIALIAVCAVLLIDLTVPLSKKYGKISR